MSVLSAYDALLPILRKAGDILLSAHQVEQENAVFEKSGTANFVTLYDIKTQEFLMRELVASYPDAKFIAEEQENDPTVLASPLCFIIDPIDGTTNFIHDYRHSCISLAMCQYGEVVFGAVLDPYLNELFYAVRGKGAFLNGRSIRVSDRPMELGLAAYGTSPYNKDTMTDATFALSREIFLACADLRRCGSAAMDLAYLAAGRNDLFYEGVLRPWDYAAGMLLVTEAGGMISDMNGEPLDLVSSHTVIAANPKIYPRLLSLCRPYADRF